MPKYIITHPGQAHRDEFLSIAIAFQAIGPLQVYRREPTEEELEDPNILVLDVGGRHEPRKMNFDHHQRGRSETPECALSLFARFLGLEEVLEFRKWYRPTILMDVLGPFATAKELGLPRFPFELSGPIEGQIIEEFEKAEVIEVGSLMSNLLCMIGDGMVTAAREYAAKVAVLSEMVKVVEIHGLNALVFETSDTEGTQDLRDKKYPDAAVALSWDDRGAGWSLYRFNDHPRVDFSVLEGDPVVAFAHKGGFIAKTRERLELNEVLGLVARAIS
jgi:hypothetical protein